MKHTKQHTSGKKPHRGNKATRQKGASQKEYEGYISLTRSGKGFVRTEVLKEDIVIQCEHTHTALPGDRVRVKVVGAVRNRSRAPHRLEGVVCEILSRAQSEFVGLLEEKNGRWILIPDDRRVSVPFSLTRFQNNLTPQKQWKGVARFLAWSSHEAAPTGELIELIGPAGEHETEMQAIVRAEGFNSLFPPAVLQEAEVLEKRKAEIFARECEHNRLDMRAAPTFTIDPDDAKDFDDAISVRTLEGGELELGVHIADVSAWVEKGGAIDNEARERGTSVYLVDRTIHMLPEVLAADVCSLRPGEDKLACSVIFTITKDFEIRSRTFSRTLIKSDKRFTYSEAQKVLEGGDGPLGEELLRTAEVARHFRTKRMEEGSIAFDTDEVGFTLDTSGTPTAVFKKEHHETMEVIEDLMLLANRAVAEEITLRAKKNKLPLVCVFRVHDAPNPEKIQELGIFLRALGYELKEEQGRVTAKEINRLLVSVKGTPEEALVETATIRSMAKAVYTTKNIGHFGLAFSHYTHFTSPIRRYPDLMVHRILKAHLDGAPPHAEEGAYYEQLSVSSSLREAAAAEAERESVKLKQVEYMAGHINETFDGVVSGVTDWGLYIEEVNTLAEGLAPIRALGDEYFRLDGRYRVKGERSGTIYSLGDKVRICLVSANIEERQIEWRVV